MWLIVWVYVAGVAVALGALPVLIFHWSGKGRRFPADQIDALFWCIGTLAGAVFWPVTVLLIVIVLLAAPRTSSPEYYSSSPSQE